MTKRQAGKDWITWLRRLRYAQAGVVLAVISALAACLAHGQSAATPRVILPVPTFTVRLAPAPTVAKRIAAQPTVTRMASTTLVVSNTQTIQGAPTLPPVAHPPTRTVNAAVESVQYTVRSGDTLSGIAVRFQTTVSALQAANQLTGDLIQADQVLTIPDGAALLASTPSPSAPELASDQNVITPTTPAAIPLAGQTAKLSILEGDLASAYPALFTTDRFTLHYAPGAIPTDHPQLLADILMRALAHHEQMLHITLPGRFDAYVAGSPFQPPDQSLRGHSYSAQRYFVFLDDGSGNLDDLTYLAAHELTHMFTWLVFGQPTDPMLSEGAAVYVGMDFIAKARHMPITTFCAAYSQAGVLPRVSAHLRYQGHIRDLENYYAGGCFVKHLIENYGAEKFGKLYPSNDYVGIYGKTLKQLDDEWHASVAATPVAVPFEPAELVRLVERLEAAHTNLFDTFTGTAQEMARYRELDPIRMALLEGRLKNIEAYFSH